MSDNRARPASRPDAEPSRTELIEVGIRRIMTSIVIAGGLIALAIYSKDEPPRYQVAADGRRVYRVNTRSGTLVGCEGKTCAILYESGQDFEDALPERALPAPGARPAVAGPEAAKAGNAAAAAER